MEDEQDNEEEEEEEEYGEKADDLLNRSNDESREDDRSSSRHLNIGAKSELTNPSPSDNITKLEGKKKRKSILKSSK
jgi:hypothetical protein